MKFLSPHSRIAMGLTGAVLAAVSLARLVFPGPGTTIMAARADIAETVALSSSALLVEGKTDAIQALLSAIVARQDDILSAGVRLNDGSQFATVGSHGEWRLLREDMSTAEQMQIPIFRGSQEKWGTIELRFRPMRGAGWVGWCLSPTVGYMGAVSTLCFLMFSYILRLVLKHLDPSKAVPRRVRDALDNLAEGLLIVDTKDNVLLANTAFSNVVGSDVDSLVGQRVSKFGLTWTDSNRTDEFPWKRALKEKRAISETQLQLISEDGNTRKFSVNCSPLLGHQGKYSGVMVTFDDVTELQEKTQLLGAARDAAEAANRAKSDFLANMSHEIRTPMNAILGFTDVLRRGMEENSEKRMEYLNTIHSSGNHLIELINDILDLSKIEAGRLELEITECEPHRILWDVVNVLRVRAEEKSLLLRTLVVGEIPAVIQSDPTRVRQVLMNLVSNAIKFCHAGQVCITCRLVGSAAAPEMEFVVTDTGIGMSENQMANIFDPFKQADNSVTRRFGGTGLGLSISKRIVEALQGRIRVESTLDAGSAFTVQVPAVFEDSVQLIDQAEANRRTKSLATATSIDNRRLRQSSILLVDDGETNRRLMKLVLRRLGLDVVEAENGQVAVDRAMSRKFDLILMDMQMPVMDGYTAASTLRNKNVAAPIIALTANAMQGDEEKCRAAGCNGYLTKPINMDRLIEILGEELGFVESEPPLVAGFAATPQVPAENHSSHSECLQSTLPMDDPEFCEIVIQFVEGLRDKLDAMTAASERGDFDALAGLAHWLKGAGGTVGFAAFTVPARQLEHLAKQRQAANIPGAIAGITELAERIEIPSATPMATV